MRTSRRAQRAQAADAASTASSSGLNRHQASDGTTADRPQYRPSRSDTIASAVSASTASTTQMHHQYTAQQYHNTHVTSEAPTRSSKPAPVPAFDPVRAQRSGQDPFTEGSPSSSPTRRTRHNLHQRELPTTTASQFSAANADEDEDDELVIYTAAATAISRPGDPSSRRSAHNAARSRGEFVHLVPALRPLSGRRRPPTATSSNSGDEQGDEDDQDWDQAAANDDDDGNDDDDNDDSEERQRETRAVDARLSAACADFWSRGAESLPKLGNEAGQPSMSPFGNSSGSGGRGGGRRKAAAAAAAAAAAEAQHDEVRKATAAARDERNAEEMMARLREVVAEKLAGERWRFEAGGAAGGDGMGGGGGGGIGIGSEGIEAPAS